MKGKRDARVAGDVPALPEATLTNRAPRPPVLVPTPSHEPAERDQADQRDDDAEEKAPDERDDDSDDDEDPSEADPAESSASPVECHFTSPFVEALGRVVPERTVLKHRRRRYDR